MESSLIKKIRNSVIGENQVIQTPFGEKPLVYADYTASGRALSFIEDSIREQILPYYANTHTETSFTGAVTTQLREQARQIIKQAVNAGDDYKLIFTGSGATGAIHKLIDILNLRLPADINQRYQLEKLIPAEEKPVVFIGPYEHHANEISWRECFVDLVVIPLGEDGQMDLAVLEQQLQTYRQRPLKIGSFSAASNVTGLKSAVDAVSSLLHRHGAYAFWDYAAAAPYVQIDMSGGQGVGDDTSKDAVFISPHKFIGGPGTPGVLVVRESLLTNTVPAVAAGGTVVFVSPESHRYVNQVERREEGGTPGIIESIRAGLVFKLQQQVGINLIEKLESRFIKHAIERLSQNNNIRILGDVTAPRLSILSFAINHQGKDLHYGYIVALLNDLFGIQARGGCSCAGPYGHHLLEIGAEHSQNIESQLLAGQMVLRPGWIRVNFNYFIDQATFEYIVRAIELLADHAWRLLPYYQFDETKGIWRYQAEEPECLPSLEAIDFNSGAESTLSRPRRVDSDVFADYLQQAEFELMRERTQAKRFTLGLPEDAEMLRWFVRPQDIATRRVIRGNNMFIRQLFDTTSHTYSYIVASTAGGEALIIDPVDSQIETYTMLIDQLGLNLLYAIDTHVHADHISAIGKLRDIYQCDTVHGKGSQATGITQFVDDGGVIAFGDLLLEAIYTPGHTIDSYCYLLSTANQKFLFSGDTLLIRGTGRTDLQGGCAKQQYQSLFDKLLCLPDNTIVYPGHDYNGVSCTTIGEERQHNPRLQVASIVEYESLMSSLSLSKPALYELAISQNLKL